jgi:hypothetical protein
MRSFKRITLTAIILLIISMPALAINRNDLIACRLGQQPEGVVCPVD